MEAAILEADNELNMRRRAKDAIVNILGSICIAWRDGSYSHGLLAAFLLFVHWL